MLPPYPNSCSEETLRQSPSKGSGWLCVMWDLFSNNLYFNIVKAQICKMSDHKGTLRILFFSSILQMEKLRYRWGLPLWKDAQLVKWQSPTSVLSIISYNLQKRKSSRQISKKKGGGIKSKEKGFKKESGPFLAPWKLCRIAHVCSNQCKVKSASLHFTLERLWLFFSHLLHQTVWSLKPPLPSLGHKSVGGSTEATREVMIPTSPFFDSSWRTWLMVVEFFLEVTMCWQAQEG